MQTANDACSSIIATERQLLHSSSIQYSRNSQYHDRVDLAKSHIRGPDAFNTSSKVQRWNTGGCKGDHVLHIYREVLALQRLCSRRTVQAALSHSACAKQQVHSPELSSSRAFARTPVQRDKLKAALEDHTHHKCVQCTLIHAGPCLAQLSVAQRADAASNASVQSCSSVSTASLARAHR